MVLRVSVWEEKNINWMDDKKETQAKDDLHYEGAKGRERERG